MLCASNRAMIKEAWKPGFGWHRSGREQEYIIREARHASERRLVAVDVLSSIWISGMSNCVTGGRHRRFEGIVVLDAGVQLQASTHSNMCPCPPPITQERCSLYFSESRTVATKPVSTRQL